MRRPKAFSNWAGNQICLPAQIAEPTSVTQVAELVGEAHATGGRIKVVGAAHSFTAAAMTDGTLLRIDALDAITDHDPATGQVTVGAGIRLNALSERLWELGLALPNLGDIAVQTLAGATATATHGTGAALGNLATGIVGLELVTGTGEVLWCDAEQHPEIFAIARVGVGALGVVTRVRLQCVPAFVLRADERVEKLDGDGGVMADWAGFRTSADHAELFFLPGAPPGKGNAFTKRNHRTDEPENPQPGWQYFLDKEIGENVALDVAMRAVRRFPGQRDRIAELFSKVTSDRVTVDRSYRVFASPRRVRFVEMEYGVPVDALPEALERVRAFAHAMEHPPLFPIEVRCSAGDDIALSTAEGRDSGWIAVHQYKGIPFGDYFRGVEAIMDDYDGRPHWGKMHFQTADVLRERYPRWGEFAAVRARLDPAGVFRNAYLDRVLGPVA